MEERDQISVFRNAEIRKKIAEGLESLRRGEGIDGDAAFKKLAARRQQFRRRKIG